MPGLSPRKQISHKGRQGNPKLWRGVARQASEAGPLRKAGRNISHFAKDAKEIPSNGEADRFWFSFAVLAIFAR
jgi:hypothetical protein